MAEDRDNKDWLDAIAGRDAGGADVRTAAEARALRGAMLEAVSRDGQPDFDTNSGLQRLMFRLRAERLVGAENSTRGWQAYGGLALAACLVLAVSLSLWSPQRPDDEPGRERGLGRPQIVSVADPAKTAEVIQRDLQALGITPRVRQFGEIVTVEADVPRPASARHMQFLKQYNLRMPDAGPLVIEVRRR